jgi:SAM-dependent methyltransferase
VSWSYGTLATEVYDLDKPIGHSFGDVEYYLQALAGMDGRILEPAVGTGRILIPLLEAGLEVEGYDTSPEMLAVCRRHCRERNLDPVISEADMTTFVRLGAYAAVILPVGSITLLDGRAALGQALARFHESLQPSGRLVVDVPATQLVTEPEPMRSWSSGEFIWTLQTMHIEYDPVANQSTRWLRYEKWRDGELVATELQPFRLQHWNVAEFSEQLLGAGFSDVTVASDYHDGRPPGSDTFQWTFQAVRRV